MTPPRAAECASHVAIRSAEPTDVDAMIEVCAAAPGIAQHARYLFWLFATLYRRRSLVATDDHGRVVAYLLSLPADGAELIAQVAVRPQVQSKGIGLGLLQAHAGLLRRDGITAVMTSIEVGHQPGESLMRRALAAGFGYRPIPWPDDADSLRAFANPEQLYRAELTPGSVG